MTGDRKGKYEGKYAVVKVFDSQHSPTDSTSKYKGPPTAASEAGSQCPYRIVTPNEASSKRMSRESIT